MGYPTMLHSYDHSVNIDIPGLGHIYHVHTAVYYEDDEENENYDKIVHEHTCHLTLNEPRPRTPRQPFDHNPGTMRLMLFTMLSTASADKVRVHDFALVSRIKYIKAAECKRAWSAIVKTNGDWFTEAKQAVDDIKFKLCVDRLSE